MTVLGIRLEDKNKWERRTPLVPDDVAGLVREHGLRVVVQPAVRRCYSDELYRSAGAEISDELDDVRVIFAVKEVPLEKLLADKVYVFFAHVIKGQPYNMQLLRRLLDLEITLIEYERIADGAGRRLIFFGREAGQAGMIECLYTLARRLEWEGTPTPLSDVRRAFEYEDLDDAKTALAEIGRRLRRGFEIDDAPLVVGFTGRGHVSHGAQEIFDLLPHQEVTPDELADLKGTNDRLVKVCFGKEHVAQPNEPGKPFDEDEYRKHPERFRGGRLVRYLPHVTVLIHGVYWNDAYPRFLTRREAAAMWKAGGQKLRVIGDVTCDVGGSIELNKGVTRLDRPTYVFDPVQNTFRDGYKGPGIVVLAVDNLPCELPRDASRNFSRVLRDFVPAIVGADYDRAFETLDLPPEIRRAVVTHQGRLTPEYEYLAESLEEIEV